MSLSGSGANEGWTDFSGQARKFHYIPADDDRALCGKWGLSPFVANAREGARLQPDNGPTKDDCAACRRKLDARSTRS
jgi:hypothetical protein